MISYMALWAHLYVIHFGAWVTFCFGATIYKNGMPKLKDVPQMLLTAMVIAAMLSAFSSHSHHYLTNILPKS